MLVRILKAMQMTILSSMLSSVFIPGTAIFMRILKAMQMIISSSMHCGIFVPGHPCSCAYRDIHAHARIVDIVNFLLLRLLQLHKHPRDTHFHAHIEDNANIHS